MENIILITGISAVALLVLGFYLLRRPKKEQNSCEFLLDLLPPTPVYSTLYFDTKTESKCRRCASVGQDSEIQVRRRYRLFKDEQNVLRHKRLAFLYSCAGCNYKSLDRIN